MSHTHQSIENNNNDTWCETCLNVKGHTNYLIETHQLLFYIFIKKATYKIKRLSNNILQLVSLSNCVKEENQYRLGRYRQVRVLFMNFSRFIFKLERWFNIETHQNLRRDRLNLCNVGKQH